MPIDRRQFLLGAASLFAAPAIVKAENVMKLWVPKPKQIITVRLSKYLQLHILENHNSNMDSLDCTAVLRGGNHVHYAKRMLTGLEVACTRDPKGLLVYNKLLCSREAVLQYVYHDGHTCPLPHHEHYKQLCRELNLA